MARGDLLPSESRSFADQATGAHVRQVTDRPSIHHHPFYYIPCFDDNMEFLFFVSHRTGRPEIFAEIRSSGDLLQMSEVENLGEWSVHPSHDGKHVYFVAGTRACRLSTQSLELEVLADFGDVSMREKGMVGAAMGTTTLSRDDRFWAVPVKVGDRSLFHLIETGTGKVEVFLESETIGHPQFHPEDTTLMRYAGPYHSRIWVTRTDGSENRLVYQRDVEKKEWIVHETWLPGTMEILTTRWPHGMFAIDVESGAMRPVCSFNAWHPMINREGNLMVADTNFPDRGLQLFDPLDGRGEPKQLCETLATNEGAHWNTDHCPYDDGPVQVYAPQHTHPHPNFSPDGKRVVFASDRTGYAQVYEVELPTA
ncbi:MAG: PD40 domain-containing protein [Candidatus Omnitrophica bacterium]|nr:PD40 domain-containing protein [Candidatus Omnitrophota bacterium]